MNSSWVDKVALATQSQLSSHAMLEQAVVSHSRDVGTTTFAMRALLTERERVQRACLNDLERGGSSDISVARR